MSDSSRHNLFAVAEAVYGTTPATPAFQTTRHTGTTLALSKSSMVSEELRADRQIKDFRHGTKQTGGDISGEFSYGTYDLFLEAALGGTWTGDVLKAGVVRRSFSMLRHFSDQLAADKPYHLFTGQEFTKLALSVAANAIVKSVFSCVGKAYSVAQTAPAGSTFPAASTTEVMDSFSGAITEGGQAIAVATEVSLTLENGIEPRFVIGSAETIKPGIGRSNLTGQVTAYFENSALLEKFINETSSSLSFTLADKAGNSYVITLPRIKYTGGQPDTQGQGPVTLAMPFQALYDDGEATNIKIQRVAA